MCLEEFTQENLSFALSVFTKVVNTPLGPCFLLHYFKHIELSLLISTITRICIYSKRILTNLLGVLPTVRGSWQKSRDVFCTRNLSFSSKFVYVPRYRLPTIVFSSYSGLRVETELHHVMCRKPGTLRTDVVKSRTTNLPKGLPSPGPNSGNRPSPIIQSQRVIGVLSWFIEDIRLGKRTMVPTTTSRMSSHPYCLPPVPP